MPLKKSSQRCTILKVLRDNLYKSKDLFEMYLYIHTNNKQKETTASQPLTLKK